MTYQIISRTIYGNTQISFQRVNADGSTCHFYEESPEYELYQEWLAEGNTPETIEL